MATKKKGLGKGLDALFSGKAPAVGKTKIEKNDTAEKKAIQAAQTEKAETDSVIKEYPIDEIKANKFQPRTTFDEEALEDLKDSITQYGVLQPVILRKLVKGYELIAGERRFRAAKLAGLKTIPAIVREYSDIEVSEIALIENLQRENLNPIEEAVAYERLLSDYGLTQELLSKRVGRSRSHIANFLRLLKLVPRVQGYLIDGTMTMGQARPLLIIEDEDLQLQAAELIISEDYSARSAEALAKRVANNPDYFKEKEESEKQKTYEREVFVTEAEDKLKMFFGTQVHIKPGKKKSKIEIEFTSQDDLNRIIETLLEKQNASVENKKELLRKFSTQGFTV